MTASEGKKEIGEGKMSAVRKKSHETKEQNPGGDSLTQSTSFDLHSY